MPSNGLLEKNYPVTLAYVLKFKVKMLKYVKRRELAQKGTEQLTDFDIFQQMIPLRNLYVYDIDLLFRGKYFEILISRKQ